MVLGAAVEFEQQVQRRDLWAFEDEVAVGDDEAVEEAIGATLAAPVQNVAARGSELGDQERRVSGSAPRIFPVGLLMPGIATSASLPLERFPVEERRR